VTRTYLFGYGSGPWGASPRRRTRAEVLAAPQFAGVDPELMRRLFALADMVIDGGSDYGFGGGWRSSAQQRELFLSRHNEVPVGGCCRLDGKRYALKAGAAHAAPPGRSYHEETTRAGRALAVDMVGDHKRANPLAAQVGLVHFADVNSEPWHYQPVEIARARSSYAGPDPLPTWPLPGETPPPPSPTEDDDMRLIQPNDGDPAVFCQAGIDATWVRDEATRDAWLALGATGPVLVPRTVLSSLVLNGPAPTANPNFPNGPLTVPSHFAAHRP
jgi:hypothetical protein